MPCVCLCIVTLEEPLHCCPQLGGFYIICCCVKVAVHLCRHLGLQFDPIEEIPCALHLCSWKNQSALFLFLKAGQKVSLRQVSLCLSTLRFIFLFVGHTVCIMFFFPQQWWKSIMYHPCLQLTWGEHKLQNNPPSALNELDCAVWGQLSVFSGQDARLKFCGRPSCWYLASLTTFGW